jgi:hypothetical protein
MTTTPYKGKSIKVAQRKIRELSERLEVSTGLNVSLQRVILRLENDRRMLAMLAAKGPCFTNPLVAFAAENLRDAVLRDECKLMPDGSFLK